MKRGYKAPSVWQNIVARVDDSVTDFPSYVVRANGKPKKERLYRNNVNLSGQWGQLFLPPREGAISIRTCILLERPRGLWHQNVVEQGDKLLSRR